VIFHSQDDAQKRYLMTTSVVKPGADKLEIVDNPHPQAPNARHGVERCRRGSRFRVVDSGIEHPGKTEQTRGWEVMSAVEESVVQRRDPKQGTMMLRTR